MLIRINSGEKKFLKKGFNRGGGKEIHGAHKLSKVFRLPVHPAQKYLHRVMEKQADLRMRQSMFNVSGFKPQHARRVPATRLAGNPPSRVTMTGNTNTPRLSNCVSPDRSRVRAGAIRLA